MCWPFFILCHQKSVTGHPSFPLLGTLSLLFTPLRTLNGSHNGPPSMFRYHVLLPLVHLESPRGLNFSDSTFRPLQFLQCQTSRLLISRCGSLSRSLNVSEVYSRLVSFVHFVVTLHTRPFSGWTFLVSLIRILECLLIQINHKGGQFHLLGHEVPRSLSHSPRTEPPPLF